MAQKEVYRKDEKTGKGRVCQVCGISSHEKTLVGLRNDRRKKGPRFCLADHPDSFASPTAFLSVVAL
jgi:hypothetical protein